MCVLGGLHGLHGLLRFHGSAPKYVFGPASLDEAMMGIGVRMVLWVSISVPRSFMVLSSYMSHDQ